MTKPDKKNMITYRLYEDGTILNEEDTHLEAGIPVYYEDYEEWLIPTWLHSFLTDDGICF